MKRIHSLLAALPLALAAGCADFDGPLQILQNQVMGDDCVVSGTLGLPRSGGVLDVGLVEAGYPGYEVYLVVQNNLANKGLGVDDVQMEGVDVELKVGGAFGALVPVGQRNFFVQRYAGVLRPGATVGLAAEVIPRQVAAEMGPAISGSELELPSVMAHVRAVGKRAGGSITSGWIDFPVKVCRWCLAFNSKPGEKPGPCPPGGIVEEQIRMGQCNPAQDGEVTCCTGGNNVLLCGDRVPKKKGM
ncbi:MAG: hypothetical protein EXR72_17765 [Myxococcales bacterium]|nr:hypothetical protein [Myxococcales bacterium]